MLNSLSAVLNILLAMLTLILAWVATRLSKRTLSYMKARDLELDTRNPWIEIHKAMVNLRIHRALIMEPSMPGGYGRDGRSIDEAIANYTLASGQLHGQLDRLNDDPLLVQISEFISANILTKDWQTLQFGKQFDEFTHQAAMKARPK